MEAHKYGINLSLAGELIDKTQKHTDTPKVLIGDLGGFYGILRKHSIIASALKVRGIDTHFVVCDGTSRICIQHEYNPNHSLPDDYCTKCLSQMRIEAHKYGINYSLAGEFIDKTQKEQIDYLTNTVAIEKIRDVEYLGLKVGEMAVTSYVRYRGEYRTELSSLDENQKIILRNYLYASMVNTQIAYRAIEKHAPVSVLVSHGFYVDYAPFIILARIKKINSIYWNSGFNDFYHYFDTLKVGEDGSFETDIRGMSAKEWDERVRMPLTEKEENRLESFFLNRYQNCETTDIVSSRPPEDTETIRKRIGIQNNKPIVCLFTHVSYELHPSFFEDLDSWVIESMSTMAKNRNINWLIKVHPAERLYKKSSTLMGLIRDKFGNVPDNIWIIEPNADINTLSLFPMIDAGISIFGTIAAELPIFGKPVISACAAHFTGRGFSLDPKNREDYLRLLEDMDTVKPLTVEQTTLAKKYAYSYFIQRQIPLNIINKAQGHWGDIDTDRLDELLPGKDPVLDKLCESIVNGQRVILGEEILEKQDLLSQLSPVSITQTEKVGVNSITRLLGFDPQGEVFTYNGQILRGIFEGSCQSCKKLLETCEKHKIFDHGVVKTSILNEPKLAGLRYDMILEHEKILFITYAHEWPSEMIKDAALFQLDLNLKLNSLGVILKDCGVTGNVLFKSTKPVFVDFLSLIFKNELTKEDWLAPSVIRTPFQPLWSNKSDYFNEIFFRMFYPYTLFPLYMMHQGRFSETRRRMLETTLNTCSEIITEKEAMANTDLDLYGSQQRALAAREYALVNDDWSKYLGIISKEIEQLNVSVDQSNYSGYYEQKGENFGFEPSEDWLPKQRAVYNALQELRPDSVLDIGSNTGWFSILAAKGGCRVVAMDNDEASMNRLYKLSKLKGLPIMPLVMDIVHPTPDVPPSPNLATDQHMMKSRIKGDALILQSANKRLQCDMVLALAIVHHLTLGQGLGWRKAVKLLSSFSNKHLVVEFVPKDDPLITGEMDFFPAFNKNPLGFEWYTKENWLRELSGCYKTIEEKGRQGNRVIFVCSEKR